MGDKVLGVEGAKKLLICCASKVEVKAACLKVGDHQPLYGGTSSAKQGAIGYEK